MKDVFTVRRSADSDDVLKSLNGSFIQTKTVSADTTLEDTDSGKVILQNPFLNFEATTFEIDDFPSGGSPVYIELDYKNNSTFIIGAYVNFSQSVIKKSIIAINPSEDWNKIYVNLTPTINESIGAQSLKVFISMLRPESMNSAELSIDNFKIIYQ